MLQMSPFGPSCLKTNMAMGPPPLINKEGKPVPLELLRGVKLCNACRAMFKASTSLSLISLKQPVFLFFFSDNGNGVKLLDTFHCSDIEQLRF